MLMARKDIDLAPPCWLPSLIVSLEQEQSKECSQAFLDCNVAEHLGVEQLLFGADSLV